MKKYPARYYAEEKETVRSATVSSARKNGVLGWRKWELSPEELLEYINRPASGPRPK